MTYSSSENNRNAGSAALKLRLAFGAALCVMAFGSGAALAQNSGSAQCRAASELLAEGLAGDAGQDELNVYREVLASGECAEDTPPATQPVAQPASTPAAPLAAPNPVDVNQGIGEMMTLLRAEGIDFEAALAVRIAQCEIDADRRISLPAEADAPPLVRAELISTCTLNSQMTIYAEGIVALHAAEDQRFGAAQQEYQNEVDARDARIEELAQMERDRQATIAADSAAYEASMEEWRRNVTLCESGQTQYCQ